MVVIVGQGKQPPKEQQQSGGDQQGKPVFFAARQVYDGRRMRKSFNRKTIDYFSSVTRYLEDRTWRRNPHTDEFFIQPDLNYSRQVFLFLKSYLFLS